MFEFLFFTNMRFLYLLFLVVMLLPAVITKDNSKRCIEKERQALLHVNPACYVNNTVGNIHDCCNWLGVHCSNHTGRVYRLDLSLFLYQYCQLGESRGFELKLNSSLLALEDLVELDFSGLQFVGKIPAFFGSFRNLRYLDLSYNQFTGLIPPQIGNLTRLESLNISQDYYYDITDDLKVENLKWLSQLTLLKSLVLSGVNLVHARDWIHVVNSLPSLTYLDLHDTRVPNSIPSHLLLSNLSKSLTYVDLSGNNLEAPSSWTWLFNLSSIAKLYLSQSQLSGPIPKYTFDLCKLQIMDLSHNNLTGNLASFLESLSCAQSSLTFLSLQHNQLSGSVPDFTVFTFLRKLLLHKNNLDGSLPSTFRAVSDIVVLNLQTNRLTGSVPDLSVFRSLNTLDLQNNNLNGSIHHGLGQLSDLVTLDLSSNSLKDQIVAHHFSKLSRLRYLDMSFNSLRFNINSDWVPPFRLETIGLASCKLGPYFPKWLQTQIDYSELDLFNASISDTIPPWFWNLSSRATLIGLSYNKLQGVLPNSSIVFDKNPVVDLSSNILEGPIPSFLSNVEHLNLSRNSFSGSVSFFCGSAICSLDLSHNNLSGKIPNCFMCDNLCIRFIDLSSNKLEGGIPSQVWCLKGLVSLNLSRNNLNGSISSEIDQWSLESLDLSNNRLSGNIPVRVSGWNFLFTLDLANNNLSGKIPFGVWIQSLNPTMFEGNPGLCGDPLPNKCAGDENNKDDNGGDEKEDLGLYMSIALGYITGFWVVCGTLVMKRSWRHAYFRFWARVYDTIFVFIALMMVSMQRKFQG